MQQAQASQSLAIGNTFLLLAQRLADASGAVIRRYFRTKYGVETKADMSPVTAADREAEQAIRNILLKERPKDGIWGEEFGSSDMNADFLWVIDPIDGTKAFATGRPIFGTLIGLYRGGEPVLGVIDQPITRERWVGGLGHATTLNGRPVKCRPCLNLKAAQVGTTSPGMFDMPQSRANFDRIAQEAAFVIYGGDCYSYGQLATGFLDAVIEDHMKLHDFAALIPIVEGAGGRITDWQGNPLGLKEKSSVLASGDARLHDELLKMLA
jgi:inositol-phosphate phosphatase/L-galactose 1-phosphate phosphatase/histidinol-phosphatase